MGRITWPPSRSTADTATEPRQIFTTLPARDQRYAYPRDVQSQVWEAWHARRDESDLVIKMNTGGGKTVVGLLMLKSCLNEGVAPAVYVCPDPYLAHQVTEEAGRLGLEVTDDPRAARFLAGRAILIVNVYKLFNGRSVFGVTGAANPPLELGSVLIDDTHACLTTVQDQFKLRIPASHEAHVALIDLFNDDLKAQSPMKLSEIGAGEFSALMEIPFWSWADRQEEVVAILHPHRDEPEFRFQWPLVAEHLNLCRAVISAEAIEVVPPCVPVDQVPSFVRARRRLYLTATLADDSVLVTHFDAAPDSIRTPVTPQSADDLGDRLIVTPQEIYPGVTEAEIRDLLVDQARSRNVVVIVPSHRRAEFWRAHAAAVHAADSLEAGLAALRAGHVGLVVLVNKYDGIDLPGDACRILALDGLPEAQGELDRLEQSQAVGSDAALVRQVHRLEQGMGRGIRSNDDYCAVLLLGSRLASRLHPPAARAKFSPATRAQLELSDDIARQLGEQDFADLPEAIELCLGRDAGWVAASRDAVVGLRYPADVPISEVAVAERRAFDLAQRRQYETASQALQPAIGATGDESLRGMLKQQAAAYMHFADPVAAQRLQVSAVTDNRGLLKPRGGVGYVRLRDVNEQGIAAAQFISGKYETSTALLLAFAALTDRLRPDPDPKTVPGFEQAMMDLARHLGFASQRPELELGNGPDVLWAIGQLTFLVIECKSNATASAISRHDIAQLSHSMDWFAEQYDGTCSATPVLIHPSRHLGDQAVAREGAIVITFERLASLRDSVNRFGRSIAAGWPALDPTEVAARLAAEQLNRGAFIAHWGQTPVASRQR